MKVALTTFFIGERYETFFREHVLETWQIYAKQYGYQIVLFNRMLRPLPGKPICWQKLLILEQPELQLFDRVVFVDPDIMIREGAPNILDQVPFGNFGYAIDEVYSQYAERWHQEHNLPPAKEVVQGGLFCLEPHHRPILQEAVGYPVSTMGEMPAISYVVNQVARRHRVDGRFNALTEDNLKKDLPPFVFKNKVIKELCWLSGWPPFRRSILRIWRENWFVHAAGAKRDLLKLSWARQVLAKGKK